MDRNRAKELLPIIQAFAEGKEVEVREIHSLIGGWMAAEEPSWSNANEYRIRPSSYWRAWKNSDELPRCILLRPKGAGPLVPAVLVANSAYRIHDGSDAEYRSYDELFAGFWHVQEDGSEKACGILEHP